MATPLPPEPPPTSSYVSFHSLAIPPPVEAGPSRSAGDQGEGSSSTLLNGLKRLFGAGGAAPTVVPDQPLPPSNKQRDPAPTTTSSAPPQTTAQPKVTSYGAKEALTAHLKAGAAGTSGGCRGGAAVGPGAEEGTPASRASRSTSRGDRTRSRERTSSGAGASARKKPSATSASPARAAAPPSPSRKNPSSTGPPRSPLVPSHPGSRFVRPTRLSLSKNTLPSAPSLARISQNAETAASAGMGPSSVASVEGKWPIQGGPAAWAQGVAAGMSAQNAVNRRRGLPVREEHSPSLSDAFEPTGGEPQPMPRRRRYSLVNGPSSRLDLSLRRTATLEDDARSVVSVGTSAAGAMKNSPSALETMRRMHGTTLSTKYWMKDDSVKECTSCQAKFALWNRRHHCRVCGHIFCNNCSPFNFEKIGRVCTSCHASLMKLFQRESRSFDDSASLAYSHRGPLPPIAQHQGASPYSGLHTPGLSRPPSLYQSTSYLRRPITPNVDDIDEDRISERSSGPPSPVSAEGDARDEKGAPDSSRQSPRTSIQQKQLLQQDESSRGVGPAASMATRETADGGRSTNASLMEEVQSPTLSAVPFRKDVDHDDDHETRDGIDEADSKDGLGITTTSGGGEEQGLGLDLGEDFKLEAPPRPAQTVPFPSTEIPAQPLSRPTSALLAKVAPARHSPSIPHFDRSLSRLSLFGSGSGPTLFPFDLSETDPDAYHREAFEVADEIPLSHAALEHIRRMIRQSLNREGVPHAKSWAKELERLLLIVADRLSAIPYRAIGDDLDVREYVRIKRIPGGRPRDSEFVSGCVITKNLIHKDMPRQMDNPKVMLLSELPLDFQRDNKFYTLDAVRAQADQAVDKLVDRICQFFPDILLVEETVSQHALRLLRDKHVSAARHVKHSALEAVARVLGADIITSVSDLADRALPTDKHRPLKIVSRCKTFRVQTFVHQQIPGGRKTILRFESDDHHKPCTLLLRGESFETLGTVKRILHMLVLVVYNAKLEGYLLHDQHLDLLAPLPSSSASSSKFVSPSEKVIELISPMSPKEETVTSQQIAATLEPYESAALSGSALIQYPPPYPLARMAADDRKIREMRQQREVEETQWIINEEAASRAQSVSGGSSSASLHELESASSPIDAPSSIGSLHSKAAALVRRPSRDVIQHPAELVKQSAFREAEERHQQHLAAWNAYCKANSDSFDPVDHQQLFVLESLLVCDDRTGVPNRLCRPPAMRSFTFYGENDRTIGAFLRGADIAQRSSDPCPSPSCHQPLARHERVYVHDGFVVKFSSEPFVNDALCGGVAMSAECLREDCACAGHLTLISNETARLSFAKFLELSFYPSDRLTCADEACSHDGQLEHVRYWHYGSVRVAIRMDRIDLRDVVPPPRQVKVRPDRQLELRNAEYDQVLRRSEAFFDSVQARILAFKSDCVPVDRLEECKTALADFCARCEADRKAISRLLKAAYERAHNTNGTEMTIVRRALQEKSHVFDAEWAAFAKRVMPADANDMRRVSTTQLKRLFPDAAGGLAVSPSRRSSSQLPPALEIDEHAEDLDSDASASSPPSEASSSLLPDEPASVNDDTSSVLSAEVHIEPPHIHVTEGSADSTATVSATPAEDDQSVSPLPSPSAIAAIARSPRVGRSPYRIQPEESDIDTDSTVCADGEHSASTSQNRASSPFIRKQFPPIADEGSAAESEMEHQPIWHRRKGGHHVANLVDAFESSTSIGRSGSVKKPSNSPSRPGMRRAQTDKPSSPKTRPSRPPVASDNDSSYARNVGVSHLMGQQLDAAAARPSRIPSRKQQFKSNTLSAMFEPIDPLDTATSPVEEGDPMGLGLCLSPSSSRVPSRGPSPAESRASSRPPSRPISPTATLPARSSTGDSGDKKARPPLKSYSSSRSTIKCKSARSAVQSESSDASRPLQPTTARSSNISRPTASSAGKMTSRRIASAGTGRVSTMRRHWDSLAANAQKTSQMRKRARPIITSQPTLRVFDNIRDAIKEDSEDERESSGSSGDTDADDEFDEEQEGPEREEDGGNSADRNGLALTRESTLRPGDITARPLETTKVTSSMSDALVRSISVASLEPSAVFPPLALPPPPAPHGHLSRSVEPSDPEFPSVPPSPVMPDSFTFPRMSDAESSGAERKSIFNAFSSLWNYRNGEFSPLAYPTIPTEHVYADNPVVLRDDEPTSIIAHALSSKRYYQASESTGLPRIREGLTANKEESVKGDGTTSPAPVYDTDKMIEEVLRAPTQRSFKLGDVELGDISARCTVFWVDQFEALRRQCGCDVQFVESLARCAKWDAQGGKSKVDFMKTLDDRFIVKQLSRPEMEVFARFAPAYFQYMADALFQGKPTVLAKVFGIYRVSLGKQYRNVDFLVMENLFYGRQLKQIFDLKGSTRNRRAEDNNPVLLDENLLELSLRNPFYVREESKQFIKQAIFNDSQFLSDLNVMDYSLVVGVDAVNAELCVGIVDYIRTYTWDKRIESWVKETTFLGGAAKSGGPTVITPKQYKMRFREAIDGYLLLTPTPWLNPRSLLPASGGDVSCKQCASGQAGGDNASLLAGTGTGAAPSTREGGPTVPPTPTMIPASAFAAAAML
ncbi:hypothetical protein JCM11251_000661 [Rhodosporidiobolus azoricus]